MLDYIFLHTFYRIFTLRLHRSLLSFESRNFQKAIIYHFRYVFIIPKRCGCLRKFSLRWVSRSVPTVRNLQEDLSTDVGRFEQFYVWPQFQRGPWFSCVCCRPPAFGGPLPGCCDVQLFQCRGSPFHLTSGAFGNILLNTFWNKFISRKEIKRIIPVKTLIDWKFFQG